MNIIIRMKIIGLFLLLALTGCASAPPRAPIAIDLGADKTFTFKSVNADGEKITSRHITSAIGDALAKASDFRPVAGIVTENTYRGKDGTVARMPYEGLKITQIPNAFKVEYIKGVRVLEAFNTTLDITSATFGYSIEEGEKIVTVKVTPPKQLEVLPHQTSQLASDEVMSTDIKRIFNNMKPEITISKVKSFKGDIDVKYSVDAVKASLKRAGCKVDRIDSKNICALENVSVNFEVVPYKEGSKTTYKFDVMYSLNGQGETTYSPAMEKKIISSLENIVKN